MFTNEPTNPKLIVSNILSLSDSWKELLTPESIEEKQAAPKKKRAPSKRKAKS